MIAYEKLKEEFISLLPEDNRKFISKFIQIKYSSKTNNMDKNQLRKNAITKYAIYKLEEKMSEENKTSFDTISATIEHIIPESKEEDESILSIGNLIILEKNLNEECEDYNFQKKCTIYKKSNYHSARLFVEKYSDETEFSIEARSRDIGDELYGCITNKW